MFTVGKVHVAKFNQREQQRKSCRHDRGCRHNYAHAALRKPSPSPRSNKRPLVWCDQTLKAAVIDPGGDLTRHC